MTSSTEDVTSQDDVLVRSTAVSRSTSTENLLDDSQHYLTLSGSSFTLLIQKYSCFLFYRDLFNILVHLIWNLNLSCFNLVLCIYTFVGGVFYIFGMFNLVKWDIDG